MHAAAADREGHNTGCFGRQLQPPGGGQPEAPLDLTDDAARAAEPQPFLHRIKHRPPGLDMQHPVGIEPSGREPGPEQILSRRHPQHRPARPRQHAGGEQRRGRAVLHLRTGTGDLMERPQREAAARKCRVDHGNTEGKHAAAAMVRAGDAGDPCTQIVQLIEIACFPHSPYLHE